MHFPGREQTHRARARAQRWSSARNRAYRPYRAGIPLRPRSRMVRESILLDTVKAIRVGIFALIRPVITSTEGRWVASTRCEYRRHELSAPDAQSVLPLFADGHHQVSKFVHQHHDIRQFFQHRMLHIHAIASFQYGSGIGRPIRAASAIFSL